MTKMISRSLVLAAGILTATRPAAPDIKPQPSVVPSDPREERIRNFFADLDCPAERYAHDFVQAADQHNLDWRLLPSLSLVESTGGKTYKNNNIFGWNNGDTKFRSVREGIFVVASRLKRARHYRGKGLDAKLHTYNPAADYPAKVKNAMRRISASSPTMSPAF